MCQMVSGSGQMSLPLTLRCASSGRGARGGAGLGKPCEGLFLARVPARPTAAPLVTTPGLGLLSLGKAESREPWEGEERFEKLASLPQSSLSGPVSLLLHHGEPQNGYPEGLMGDGPVAASLGPGRAQEGKGQNQAPGWGYSQLSMRILRLGPGRHPRSFPTGRDKWLLGPEFM